MDYTGDDGKKHRVVVLHVAIFGSFERFMGILIEHFTGNFPAWLSPVQVVLIPVRENHENSAQTIASNLKTLGMRVEFMDASENMGGRVRKAKNMKVPYTIILGDKDIEAGMITVEKRGEEKGTQMKLEDFIEKLTKEIKDRALN